MSKKQENIAYADAIKELESIVAELEEESVDVDSLGEKVKRASLLIRICKSKLYNSTKEISQALEELSKDDNESKEGI